MPAVKNPAARKKARAVAPLRCSVCKASGPETFWFLKHSFIFDVDRARKITQDGRKPILLDRNDVRYAVDSSRINDSHVPHVNVQYPGIIARVRFVKENGRVVRGDVLIDGHHRAARCLQLSRPFFVYLLTHDESDQVLTRRPDAARRRKLLATRRTGKSAKPRRRVAKKQR
jgi:hypothetical protein